MRTRHLYKIVGAVLLLAAVTRAAAQSLNSIYNAQRPVVIVCDWDKPPYEFLDDKGRPAGSNIDVLEAVFKQLNIPCHFVMKEWSIALKTFQRGDAYLILANARRYRKAPYVVSDNVINYNRIRVAMFSDTTQMVTMKQLEREGAVFKPGDYSAQYFQDTDSASLALMEYQTPKVALLGLINGDYRYYVWGEEPLKWKIKELNLEGITLNDVSIPISEIHVIGRDSEERGEYVRIIRNSSDMLQRLINDIIEASSLTDGPTSLMPMNVNFAASFEDICLTLQSRVQDAGLSFVKDNPYTTFMTTLDIGRVQQVMTNFVTNAVKFTKKGHIRLGYRYDRHGLYVFCEDTGIGIPRDKQEQIFERFVKLDEFVQGTGMGLAICKSIVERCGGEIGVESDGPDLGSTFWFWIPCERRLS